MNRAKFTLLVLLGSGALLLILYFVLGFSFKSFYERPSSSNPFLPEIELASDETGIVPRIRDAGGTVIVRRGTTIYAAKTGLQLQHDDIVQTGPTSSADILWPLYGHSVLGPESTLVIDLSDIAKESLSIRIRLEAGKVWTRIQKLLNTDSYFGIESSNVVSIVRGTAFGVERQMNTVKVRVTEDDVRVFRIATSGSLVPTSEQIIVNAGEEAIVPIGLGTERRPIPPAQISPPDRIPDPILQQGNLLIADAELLDLKGPRYEPPRTPKTLLAIEFQNKIIPLSELFVFSDIEAACTGPHYHAERGSVTTLDGTVIQDPDGCGFGLTDVVPVITFEVY